ncbi:MAG: hypothetical protein ACOVQN_04420 [Exiguobacterium sp.]
MRAVVFFLVILAIQCVVAVPPWQRVSNPEFTRANQAQLDAISANPSTDLWYQNITIYGDDPQTGAVPIANYGYWQSRIYNENIGAFEEVQAWYRTETILALQQINSEVLRPEFTVDPDGGVMRQDQGYRVYWTTNVTFDSISVIGLQKRSSALGSNVVRIAFIDPSSGRATFTEELLVLKPQLRRRYTNTFVVDPSGNSLPLTILFDSFVVPIEAQPPAVRGAFQAYRAGQVPKQEDPAAQAAGIPFNLVYLYTHPVSARSEDIYYHGQPSLSVYDLLLSQNFE